MTDATAAPAAETKGFGQCRAGDDGLGLRAHARMVVLWIPLACFVIILLFPFYWMTVTAFKPDAELYNFAKHNPLLDQLADARPHLSAALQDVVPRLAEDDDDGGVRRDLPLPLCQYARGLRDPAVALPGQPVRRPRDLSRLPGAAIDLVHSAGDDGRAAWPVRQPAGADPRLSDLPHSVLHVAADRIFQVDPLRARRVRADRWCDAPSDPPPHHPAACRARA